MSKSPTSERNLPVGPMRADLAKSETRAANTRTWLLRALTLKPALLSGRES